MLVIRLSRKGRRNFPMYRITVAENSMPTDGKFVEVVGSYSPTAADQPLVVQKDRVEYWISKGAKPTNTVSKLLNKQGFTLPVLEHHKAPKKVAKPAETVPANPVAPSVSEKPAEESVPAEEKKEEVLNQPYDSLAPGRQSPARAGGQAGRGQNDEMKDSVVAPEAPQNDGGETPTEEVIGEQGKDAESSSA
ncbi:MAG: 30S ribosomal protein S16 [Patescibacteria group bacterium]